MLTGTRAKAASDRLPAGAAARGFDDREHLVTGRPVIAAIQPGNGHEMRKLPEKERQGKRQRPSIEVAADCGPADQHREAPATAPTAVFMTDILLSGV